MEPAFYWAQLVNDTQPQPQEEANTQQNEKGEDTPQSEVEETKQRNLFAWITGAIVIVCVIIIIKKVI